MNYQDPILDPKTEAQLLVTLTAGLLASGHDSQLVPIDVPVEPGESHLLQFSYEDDDGKKKYRPYVLNEALFLLKQIEDSVDLWGE
jgi:hypothetical protein